VVESDLIRQLQNLEQLDLILPEPDQSTYRFRNTLIQDVAYSSLLFRHRRELHQGVATLLEKRCKQNLEPVYEVLVHHYSISGIKPKIRFYAFRAADKARRVFAHEEAIDYYASCLDTVEKKDWCGLSLRSYFLELMADCYEISGQHKDAAHFMNALRQEAGNSQD
jgi:predicted ATPase